MLINLSQVYKLEKLSYMFNNTCSGGQAEIAGWGLPPLQGHGFQCRDRGICLAPHFSKYNLLPSFLSEVALLPKGMR